MAKKCKIITKNKEIYNKFNLLHFSSEVIFKDVRKMQIDRIIKSINKKSTILSSEVVGKYIIVRKKGPLNFDIYLR